MWNIKIGYREILLLGTFFTALAVYLNIHEERHVFDFIVGHFIALLLALVVSRVIYEIFKKRK